MVSRMSIGVPRGSVLNSWADSRGGGAGVHPPLSEVNHQIYKYKQNCKCFEKWAYNQCTLFIK